MTNSFHPCYVIVLFPTFHITDQVFSGSKEIREFPLEKRAKGKDVKEEDVNISINTKVEKICPHFPEMLLLQRKEHYKFEKQN